MTQKEITYSNKYEVFLYQKGKKKTWFFFFSFSFFFNANKRRINDEYSINIGTLRRHATINMQMEKNVPYYELTL